MQSLGTLIRKLNSHFIGGRTLSRTLEQHSKLTLLSSVIERFAQTKNCDIPTDEPVIPEVQNLFEDMYGNLKNESGLEEIMGAMKELVDQYVGNCKNGGFWRQYADNILERYNKNKIN